jgi:hypothetical protein
VGSAVAKSKYPGLRLKGHVERSVAPTARPDDHPAERQRLLALPPVGRAVTFVVVLWHSGSGPASASAWLVILGRVQVLRWERPGV